MNYRTKSHQAAKAPYRPRLLPKTERTPIYPLSQLWLVHVMVGRMQKSASSKNKKKISRLINAPSQLDPDEAAKIRRQILTHISPSSFAEVAALKLAESLSKKGRKASAVRLLQAYLEKYGPCTSVTEALARLL